MPLPQRDQIREIRGEQANAKLIGEADAIKEGRIRIFIESVALDFPHIDRLKHWSEYKENQPTEGCGEDIKFTWEPARFGWAYILARAYHLTGDESYCETFWSLTEKFLENNPPNLGCQWMSGQEVALRILAFAFAWNVFSESPASTIFRQSLLAWAITRHAERIPPTLIYARAQNNNHLLSEAAGLYTASVILPDHPKGRKWKKLGLRWFCEALRQQISDDGTYIQQSTNYHRMMLQLALWMSLLLRSEGEKFPAEILEQLKSATVWLSTICDPMTGEVPNLGPNDGALIQPLDNCEFNDFRPVLQAASYEYLDAPVFSHGEWDEDLHWYGIGSKELISVQKSIQRFTKGIETAQDKVCHKGTSLWAYLRAPRFTNRPGHADLLHVDIWWQGLNVAMDAGTYRYHAPQPWDNGLAGTTVHNTLVVDETDQMRRAGRFLWLDWAQAKMIDRVPDDHGGWESLTAEHNGYRKMGLVHRRRVSLLGDSSLEVFDQLLPTGQSMEIQHDCTINWLVPDWQWEINPGEDGEREIQLVSPKGNLSINITCRKPEKSIQSEYWDKDHPGW